MALTDTSVRNAKPAMKPVRLFDDRGLYIEISPSGGKWWRFKYRFSGKEKRLSLGVYPDVSLKDARNRRDEKRRLLASGIDPSEDRKATKLGALAKRANSFELVAMEWFNKYSVGWAKSHSDRQLQLLKRDIFPWIGERPVSELTSLEILVSIRRIEGRGAVDTAHRALGTCSQILRYAVATGRCERDLCVDLRGALPPVKGKHFAAITEPARIGEMLRVLDGYKGSLIVRCALRLAPLVFVRPGELRKAQWADLDLVEREWRFTVSKTKVSHIVPLSHQALALLLDLQPLTGKGRYVFPSARSSARPMSDNAILSAMRRAGIDREEMSGHGFRALARTVLDEVLGFRPDFIEHQLAHAVRDPNGRAYNRTAHLPERRAMMQRWSDYLDALKGQPDASASN